ncbi:hypothetical protein ACOMHN_065772 [Nucella lapillus]
MPDTMAMPQPHYALPVRSSKESPRGQTSTNPCAGFPDYLKDMDLLGDNGNHAKFTTANSLFQSVLRGRIRSTEYQLDRGTAVDGRNDYGFSVLTAALHIDDKKRRDKMFRLLLQRGADPHFKDGTHDRNVLHWACVLGRAEQVETLLTEVAADLDLREKDNSSHTALHHAVMAGHLPVVRLLVDIHRKFGVTVDMADRLGLTPYLHAKRLGYREVAEHLHSEGCASQGQCDLLFRSPREWSQIGRFERQKAVQVNAVEAINNAKIQGKLKHLRSLGNNTTTSTHISSHHGTIPDAVMSGHSPSQHPPRVRLPVRHADRLSTSLPILQEDGRPLKGMRRPTSANGVGRGTYSVDNETSTKDSTDSGAAATAHASRPPPREAFVHESPTSLTKDLDHPDHPLIMGLSGLAGTGRRGQGSGEVPVGVSGPGDGGGVVAMREEGGLPLLHLRSTRKGPRSTAAFTLMEMNEKGRHASTYRQSQFDETKASEYKHILGSLNSIMDMLAHQQSRSFRKSVRYQRPETPKKAKPKTKVSSLAVIFGRDKGGRRSKRRSARPVRKKESASSTKKKKGGEGEEKKAKVPEKKKALPLLKVNGKVV